MKYYPRGRFYMKKRVNDKIKEISMYLRQLMIIKPKSFDKYSNDFKSKAACERYFERISESLSDLAVLVIKEKGFPLPDESNDCFEVLGKENIVDSDLTRKMKEMKGMRNIIAHQYGSIDNELVYSAIDKELGKDVKTFIKIIEQLFVEEDLR